MVCTKRIAASLFLMTPFLSSAAQACRCPPPPPPEESMAKSTAVFVGRAVSVEREGGTRVSVKFAVDRTWKGDDAKEVVVVTPTNSCGRTFEKGKQYMVYATADEGGTLGTNLCDRTMPHEQAADDMKALGEGKEPIEKRHIDAPGQPDKRLLVGRFRAVDLGSQVVLYASGFNSSAGVTSGLTREPGSDGVPQFRLHGEPRRGQSVGAAMTPFLVSEVLPPLARTAVRVRDARGVHDVRVDRAAAVSYPEWERLAYPQPAEPPQ
jgi:hypothetical protein